MLGQMQHRFRKGWRSSDALFTITQIIEMRNKAKKGMGLAFLDLRKAYDSVNRGKRWRGWDMGEGGGKQEEI